MIAQSPKIQDVPGDRYISYETALGILPIGRTKLSEIVLAGEIDSILVGSRRLLSLSSLRAFIEARSAANRNA